MPSTNAEANAVEAAVRADYEAQREAQREAIFIQIGLTAIAGTAREGAGNPARPDVTELYRRHLWLMLGGLRPRPEGKVPLPVEASTRSEAHDVSTDERPQRRRRFANEGFDIPPDPRPSARAALHAARPPVGVGLGDPKIAAPL
jgi:hypothetical protein